MNAVKRVILFSLLYSALNLGMLIFFPAFQAALAQAAGSPTVSANKAAQIPAQKASAPAGGASAPSGPATQEFVDVARLVLESNRDNTAHLGFYIERATMLIVVFFSVLGAAGTVFGLKKSEDFQRRADAAADDVEQGLKAAKTKIESFEAEQRSAMQKLVTDLGEEMRDYAALMTARMDIGRAMNDPAVKDQPAAARMLQNAAKTILAVVGNHRVSRRDRMRGYAEAAFALKRTGSTDEAYAYIKQAVDLAEDNQSLAVLHYNGACYAALLGQNSQSIEHLAIAIKNEPAYKGKALIDGDLQALVPLQAFQSLVQ